MAKDRLELEMRALANREQDEIEDEFTEMKAADLFTKEGLTAIGAVVKEGRDRGSSCSSRDAGRCRCRHHGGACRDGLVSIAKNTGKIQAADTYRFSRKREHGESFEGRRRSVNNIVIYLL